VTEYSLADILSLPKEGRTNTHPLRSPARYGAGRVNPFLVSSAPSSHGSNAATAPRTAGFRGSQGARTHPGDDIEITIQPANDDIENGENVSTDANRPRPTASQVGYPALAKFMASDSVFRIFRRFDFLTVRTLLYLQDELCELEDRLNALDDSDLQRGNHAHTVSLHSRRHDQNQQRKALLAEIQVKLKTYREWKQCNDDTS
jgi:hypothetical protein